MTTFLIVLLKTLDRIGPFVFIATTIGIYLHSRNFNERVFKETHDKWYRDASDDELRSHLMHPFGTFSKKQ